MLTDAEIARYIKICPYLDEQQRHCGWAWRLGDQRRQRGRDRRATGADMKTVRQGKAEIESGAEPGGRMAAGGRRPVSPAGTPG